jgi:hypothetical protein
MNTRRAQALEARRAAKKVAAKPKAVAKPKPKPKPKPVAKKPVAKVRTRRAARSFHSIPFLTNMCFM